MTLPVSLGVGRLSEQHLRTLRLTANGLSSQQIAARSGRSLDAVNSDFRVIKAVLRVASRAQAVAVALRLGLVPLEAVVLPEAVSAAVRPVGRPVGPEARPMAARPSDRACVSDLGAA